MSKSKGSFTYLFIPADSSAEVEARSGDPAGGLSSDELVEAAKAYFFEQSGGSARAAALADASPEERQQLVQKVREEQKHNPHLSQLTDDQILAFVESTHANPTCEIMALTVPTRGNGYRAVSMYVSEHGTVLNERASNLMKACGHRLPENASSENRVAGVYGDVFVGRCYDNEGGDDDWIRVDFGVDDLEELSDWIAIAKSEGGGGGSGTSNAASLSGTMSQIQAQQEQQQEELGYNWDQTQDEVELRFSVDGNVKAKEVSVKFSRSALKVDVAGEALVEGPTGGTVVVDDSTYTLQDDGRGGRELCVVLGKYDVGKTWAFAVKKN